MQVQLQLQSQSQWTGGRDQEEGEEEGVQDLLQRSQSRVFLWGLARTIPPLVSFVYPSRLECSDGPFIILATNIEQAGRQAATPLFAQRELSTSYLL